MEGMPALHWPMDAGPWTLTPEGARRSGAWSLLALDGARNLLDPFDKNHNRSRPVCLSDLGLWREKNSAQKSFRLNERGVRNLTPTKNSFRQPSVSAFGTAKCKLNYKIRAEVRGASGHLSGVGRRAPPQNARRVPFRGVAGVSWGEDRVPICGKTGPSGRKRVPMEGGRVPVFFGRTRCISGPYPLGTF
jgi:hypothetical protein